MNVYRVTLEWFESAAMNILILCNECPVGEPPHIIINVILDCIASSSSSSFTRVVFLTTKIAKHEISHIITTPFKSYLYQIS